MSGEVDKHVKSSSETNLDPTTQTLASTPAVLTSDPSMRDPHNGSKDIANKLQKWTREARVGLAGFAFRKLKEESKEMATIQNKVQGTQSQSRVTTTNPTYLLKVGREYEAEKTSDDNVILNDENAICREDIDIPRQSLRNKSDSYSNLYNQNSEINSQSSVGEDNNVKKFNYSENHSHDKRNNKRKFAYGSREYLDELEDSGPSAVHQWSQNGENCQNGKSEIDSKTVSNGKPSKNSITKKNNLLTNGFEDNFVVPKVVINGASMERKVKVSKSVPSTKSVEVMKNGISSLESNRAVLDTVDKK